MSALKATEPQYWWTSATGAIEFELPRQAIEDCHHQGSCDADVEHWQRELNLELPRKPMIRELLEHGAWDVRELCSLSNEELEHKLIWIAAGDIQDDPEYDFSKELENET